MHLKRCGKTTASGRQHWKLVESYRTSCGPRHRTIAYLGALTPEEMAVVQNGTGFRRRHKSGSLFNQSAEEHTGAQWAEVNLNKVRVERCRDFGAAWLGLQVLKHLELDTFLESVLPEGREEVSWALMAQILVLCRFCEPSSELRIADHIYERGSLEDLLGVAACKVNDDRLYRALDKLLPHRHEVQNHLQQRLGELFDLDYDLLLYDITSTFFEGQCESNSQAQRGYSRDQRPDCKQVCIALVVTRCGMPLCYEVLEGNRSDVTTVEEMVLHVENCFGRAGRIWVMDRGMVSTKNLSFLRSSGRRFIVGCAKSFLKPFAADLVNEEGWQRLLGGVEVKFCTAPEGESERFILCRSEARRQKERAMHERAACKLEEGLKALQESCGKRKHAASVVYQRIGRLKTLYSRASSLFEITLRERSTEAGGGVDISWVRRKEQSDWNQLSEGSYLLRTNITEWTEQELWEAYIQLTQAEEAFRIQKQDLKLRPVWHQKEERVQAHIMVCFLAYVLWKTLGKMCRIAGLGDEPRRVLDEIRQIRMADVVLPTREGIELRRRCVTHPTPEQAILLHRLKLKLPKTFEVDENVVPQIREPEREKACFRA